MASTPDMATAPKESMYDQTPLSPSPQRGLRKTHRTFGIRREHQPARQIDISVAVESYRKQLIRRLANSCSVDQRAKTHDDRDPSF